MKIVAPPLQRFGCALGLVAGLLAACDDGGALRMTQRVRAAQARADPPQLWSVQATGQAGVGRPVRVCTDAHLRSAFTSAIPAHGERHCARWVDLRGRADMERYRCALDGRNYAVISTVKGDPGRDFTTASQIHALDGSGSDYFRTLRFRRLGACPPDWIVGDSTDQAGRRVSAAASFGPG